MGVTGEAGEVKEEGGQAGGGGDGVSGRSICQGFGGRGDPWVTGWAASPGEKEQRWGGGTPPPPPPLLRLSQPATAAVM